MGREKWNLKHRNSAGKALGAPSPWLLRHEDQVESTRSIGPALDVACGRGRHAMYLARLGFEVEAVDFSSVATADLAQRAGDEGLHLKVRTQNLALIQPPPDTYGLVLVFRFLDRGLMPALQAALRPGGLLIYETFLNSGEGEPSMNPAFLLQKGELPRLVPDLEPLAYEEVQMQGEKRAVARLLARRGPALDSQVRDN